MGREDRQAGGIRASVKGGVGVGGGKRGVGRRRGLKEKCQEGGGGRVCGERAGPGAVRGETNRCVCVGGGGAGCGAGVRSRMEGIKGR